MGAGPRRKALSLLVLVALAGATYACGGDDDDDDELAPSQSGTPEPTNPEPTTPASDPCAPYGTLVPHALNDRCDWLLDLGTDLVAAADDDPEAVVWGDSSCVNMLATPGQLVFTMAEFDESGTAFPPHDMATEAETLVNDLDAVGIPAAAGATLTDWAGIVEVTASMATVRGVLPQLQRENRSVDFNYLEAALPNNVFRPFDDPRRTEEPTEPFGDGAGTVVAVIDSAASANVTYDVDGNQLVDEDHGHGEFVTSIVARSGAQADLIGLPQVGVAPAGSLLPSGRWAPMMFSDGELISALANVGVETEIVNLSLGGVGCPSDGPGVAIGERLALAQAMDNMVTGRVVNGFTPIQFVAAAGNHGPDDPHFPAAWRRDDVTLGLATDPTIDPAAIPRLQGMHARLADAIWAVGSVDQDGKMSSFSNCGRWVNAAAFGAGQIGAYQVSPTGFATWSGTSFAAANFSAALAGDVVGSSLGARHMPTGAYETGAQGLPCT